MVSAPLEVGGLMIMGITLLLMLLIPVLPGQFIIWLLAMLYGVLAGWDKLGIWVAVILTLLMVVAAVVDAVAGWWGARRGGARTRSIAVGLGAGLVGIIFLNALGALLGILAGIVLMEYSARREWKPSLRAAGGYLLGLLVSLVVRFFIAAGMVGIFAWHVL